MAWHPLGWAPVFFSEIDKFPRAALAHHWPQVPCHGDFTTIEADTYEPIQLLAGGTPCQDFSIAGLREGLDGDRGNLTLEFLRLAQRLRPRWVVWENVPGVLSSTSHDAPDYRPPDIDLDAGDGPADGEEIVVEDRYDADEVHAFACVLAGFSEIGYGIGYRVLDAQYFGLAQRRKRVFVVGYLGDWRPATAVLLERESLRGHPPPRRETGQDVVPTINARPSGGGGLGTDFDLDGGVVPILEPGARTGVSTTDLRAGAGIGDPGDPMFTLQSGKQHAVAFNARQDPDCTGAISGPIDSSHPQAQAAAWSLMPQNSGKDFKARAVDVSQPVMAGGPAGGNQGGGITFNLAPPCAA